MMKLIEYNKQKSYIKLLIEVPEDLYYLSLILEKNDIIYSWTTRQLKIERATESIKGKRIRVYLGIRLTSFEFHKFLKNLRIRGVVIDAPEDLHIKGSYHTLSISVGSELLIYKENFSPLINRILKMASAHYKKILLLSIGDDEISVGFLSPQGIEIKFTQQLFISKKREKGYSLLKLYGEVFRKFFEEKRDIINLNGFNEVIIASTSLFLPMLKEIFSEKRFFAGKTLRYVQVSEGGKAGIYELLRREDLKHFFKDTRYVYEKEKIDELFSYLIKGDNKIAIGLREVRVAADYKAIKTLVLNDSFFFDINEKEKIRDILEKTIEASGEIIIISSESEHGKKLEKIGNIAAILYFKIVN